MIAPYYDSGGITIYNARCEDVLPFLQKSDLLLTDPPYGINYATSRRSRSDKLRVPVNGDENIQAMSGVWNQLLDVLKDDRHWYSFASPRMLPSVMELTSPKHVICWDKGDRGTVGDLKCGFGEAWEAILYGMKGRRELRGTRPRTVVRFDWSGAMDPQHPTVKPIPLLQKLIAWSTDAGETVLDPFAGSCTTLVAAKLTGRRAIGIEMEEKYCEVGVKRLQQGVLEFTD